MGGEGLLEGLGGIVGGVGVEGLLVAFRGLLLCRSVVEVALIGFERDFQLGQHQLQLERNRKSSTLRSSSIRRRNERNIICNSVCISRILAASVLCSI